ncbi:MAG: efflux RND transporter periplasmic adaptor subunit [Bacillota bacterium]|nr:efflux RND transporter periplasmic adaptor subunit [Bacillota bacterium]
MKNKLLLGGIIVVIVIIVAVVMVNSGQTAEVAAVQKGSISQIVEDTGYVQAVDDYEIEAPLNGRVVQIEVEAGEMVIKDQLLMVVENLDLNIELQSIQTQIAQAQSELSAAEVALNTAAFELKTAELDFERKKQLLQIGALTQVEYEEAERVKAAAKQAEASQRAYLESLHSQIGSSRQVVKELEEKKQQLTICSPMDGIVFDLPVQQGDVVVPGRILAQVGVPEELEVKADLLSDDLRDVRVGQKVIISAPLLGDKQLAGKVEKIEPRAFTRISALGVEQRRVEVIISLENVDVLRPGYEVQAAIQTELREEILTISREALRTDMDGNAEVLLIEGDRVIHQRVVSGLKNQEKVEIQDGLKEGNLVVRDASVDLKEKSRIKPFQKD